MSVFEGGSDICSEDSVRSEAVSLTAVVVSYNSLSHLWLCLVVRWHLPCLQL